MGYQMKAVSDENAKINMACATQSASLSMDSKRVLSTQSKRLNICEVKFSLYYVCDHRVEEVTKS